MTYVNLKLYLPSVMITFWFSRGNPLIYIGPCIGALKANNPLPVLPISATFHYGEFIDEKILNKNTLEFYLRQLEQWGFRLNRENYPNYRVNFPANLMEWFSTLCVLRYTYESPDLINWWYRKATAHPNKDPWLIFMLRHRCHPGHALISQWFNNYVDPRKVLEKLINDSAAYTEFNGQFGGLFDLWGDSVMISNQDNYENYLAIGKLNEQSLTDKFEELYAEMEELKKKAV